MSRHRLALAASAVAILVAGQAAAQAPPTAAAPAATGRCTGLFCDVYYASRPAPTPGVPEAPSPTALPCHDFLCAAFGGRTPDAPPPAQEAAVAPEPAPMQTKTSHRKHKAHKAAAASEATK